MHYKFKIIISAVMMLSMPVQSQEEFEITQDEWIAERDKLAVDAILMLARIDSINMQIDSLNAINDYIDNIDCEEELYKIAGATRSQVMDFRIKFEATESKISSQSGASDDARRYYYNEISASKLICIPEFYERFVSMEKKLKEWENTKIIAEAADTLYTVASGDFLKRIARINYGDPEKWTLIWEANKDGVFNSDEFAESYKKKVTNPDRIYPGQVLFIPSKPR